MVSSIIRIINADFADVEPRRGKTIRGWQYLIPVCYTLENGDTLGSYVAFPKKRKKEETKQRTVERIARRVHGARFVDGKFRETVTI